MADRYWVGGTASWDGLALLKWSATSGGLGGASVPTTADDVFFDNLSTGTCTIAAGNTGAKSINCTGFTGTIVGNVAITVAGSVTLVAGMTYSHSATVTFTGTGTLTTAGKSFSAVNVNGAGITLTLGDALNTGARNFTVTQGTFDAAGYNVTVGGTFASTNSNVRTITMGSGLWTLGGTGTIWNTATTTNLTFNKNTANILLSNTTSTARTFNGGGLLFNKLTIGGATGTSIVNLGGVNTFSELASTKTVAHTISFLSTANGTTIDVWSVTGTVGNVVSVVSGTVGTQRSFNLTNVTSGIDYLAVRDIAVNQTNRFYVGANSINNGNNLNVIFTAPPNSFTITAVNGTYLVSGQNATLSFGRLLSAQNGVYSVAGQAVDISVGAPPAPTLGIELFVEIRSFTERRRF